MKEPTQPTTKTVRFDELDPIPTIAFLLVVATDLERKWMLSRMKPLPGEPEILKVAAGVDTFYLGQCGLYPCALVNCEAGSGGRAGSTLTVSDAIGSWRPYGVLLVGIAFGHDEEKHKLGDVLVSTQVIPYELERVSKEKGEQRGPRPEANQTLLDRVRHLGWTWRPDEEKEPREAIRGPILSGEKLVDDKQWRDDLFKEFPTADGGEMEGAGLYAAAARRNRAWLIVKAFCDWGYNKNKDLQPLAARNATSLIEALLSEPTVRAEDLSMLASPAESRADRAFREAARNSRFHELRIRAAEAREAVEAKAKALNDFLLANYEKLDVAGEKPALLEAHVASLNGERSNAVEKLLNTYDEAASAMLTGEIDSKKFVLEMGPTILELCEDEEAMVRARIHPRSDSSFRAIWAAYDEVNEAKTRYASPPPDCRRTASRAAM